MKTRKSIAQRQADRRACSGEVGLTAELRRILTLKRRRPLEVTPEEVTATLGGDGMTLREGQTLIISDMWEWNAVLASLPVGEGKTLPTHVLPHLFQARRPVLIIPGNLRGKTARDFAKLDHHWPAQPVISYKECRHRAKLKRGSDKPFDYWEPGQVLTISYAELSRDADLMFKLDPDLVMADECHMFKNLRAGCTRHFRDWRLETMEVPLLLTSGTISDRSLRDFAHLLLWTHGKWRMPLPNVAHELSVWARATDEKEEVRANPGALANFLPKDSPGEIEDYRKAVGDWIFDTPGCVRTPAKECNCSMTLQVHRPQVGKAARTIMKRMQSDKKDRHGMELTPAEVWQHVGELALEFNYEWEEPGPEEWMRARAAWKKQVRDLVELDYKGLTTERQIANACLDGKLPDGRYRRWKAIQDTFKPKKKAVWHGTKVLEYIIKLAGKQNVWVWVYHKAVGQKLRELTDWPYFADEGLFGKHYIEDHRNGPAIVSIGANTTGRNLQFFHRNIIATPPSKGLIWEQLMGRTARSGQLADTVFFDLLCTYQGKDLEQAMNDCRYQTSTEGQKRKLLVAQKLHLADFVEAA